MSQTPSYQKISEYKKMGLGEFYARQYSEEWIWSQNALYRLGERKLYTIYKNLTEPQQCVGVGMTRTIYKPVTNGKRGPYHTNTK